MSLNIWDLWRRGAPKLSTSVRHLRQTVPRGGKCPTLQGAVGWLHREPALEQMAGFRLSDTLSMFLSETGNEWPSGSLGFSHICGIFIGWKTLCTVSSYKTFLFVAKPEIKHINFIILIITFILHYFSGKKKDALWNIQKTGMIINKWESPIILCPRDEHLKH